MKKAHTVCAYLTLILEITLVGNDDDGERVLILYPQNLLMEGTDFLKRVSGCDRVDKQKPFPRTHVLLSHSSADGVMLCERSISKSNLPIFLLTSRIPKGQLHVLSIDLNIGDIVLEDGWDIDLSSHSISLVGIPRSSSSHFWVDVVVLFVSAISASC